MTPQSTQQQAFVFHGYGATPEDHWFGWIADQLGAEGIPTAVPALPDPLDPSPTPWTKTVADALGRQDERKIVVAHNLGCLAVLRYVQSLPGSWRRGALVLVSGFTEPLPALPELDDVIGDSCGVSGLAARIDRIVVIRSDDDALVPLAHTESHAERLGVSARVVPRAGHFLAGEGSLKLPVVLDAVSR